MRIDRLAELMRIKNISTIKLGEQVGVTDAMVGRWCKGKATPSSDKLAKIADFLECSTDYLLGRSDVAHPSSGTSLTESEMELIEYFRQLSRTGQRHVLNSAEEEMRIEAEKGTAATTA